VVLRRNSIPDIKYESSPKEYFKLFFTEYVVTLLVGESNSFLHQYYIQQETSSLLQQGITGEEKKIFNTLIL
jgi:hypothetical protein